MIRSKDFRLAQNITDLQLAYVLTIAYCNRVVQCSLHLGYAIPSNASRLKQIASGIQLPDVLATYIESIGYVTLPSGATVAPFAGDYAVMFPNLYALMLDPAAILIEAERPVPPGDWALDTDWIIDFNDATTRAARSGMNFRTVVNSSYEGRLEMVVSYKTTDDGLLLPEAPTNMTEAEAQLGAVYRFRDYELLDDWLGENKELLFNSHIAIPLDPRVIFSDLCVAAFRGMHVVTD